MNDKIIWYRTFYDSTEAHIIRAKLEDSGFHCFLADENISTIQPLYNQAVGGVKLMVLERDIPQIELLLSEENNEAGIAAEYKIDSAKNESDKFCEKCGSANVGFGPPTKGAYSWVLTLVSLALSIYPFRLRRCYHCFDCGHEFH